MIRLIAFLLCLVTGATTALADDRLWSVKAQVNPRLALAFPGSDTQYYPLLADLGVGVVRISAAWKRIEPKRGRFDFRGLDARVRALDALGIAPFITFESNADWAVDHGDVVKNGTPRNIEEWANFISTVANRYATGGPLDAPRLQSPVRYYQVANEFLSPTNKSGGWAGTPEQLLLYVNEAHDAVKGAAPDAIFVLGGIATFNLDALLLDAGRGTFRLQQRWSDTSTTVFDPATLRDPNVRQLIDVKFKQTLGTARYDWASAHLYGPEGRDLERLKYLQDLSGKPVMSSECGGPSLDYGAVYSGQSHFRAVIERNLNTQAAGAPFCMWFGLGEGITSTFGNRRVQIYDTKGQEKPGATAYRILSRLLVDDAVVDLPAAGLYTIKAADTIACVAVNEGGIGALGQSCNGPALCIENAQTQQTKTTTTSNMHTDCSPQSVVLAGDMFWQIMKSDL